MTSETTGRVTTAVLATTFATAAYLLASAASAQTPAPSASPPKADCTQPTVSIVSAIPPNVTRATSANSHYPYYPPKLARMGISGKVAVAFDIDINGRVHAPQVVTSSGNTDLDNYALQLVLGWEYHPALCDGRAIVEHTMARINWDLGRKFGMADIVATANYFPEGAIARGEHGVTYLLVGFDKDGNATEARVTKSSGYADLDAVAQTVLFDKHFKLLGRLLVEPSPEPVAIVWPGQAELKVPVDGAKSDGAAEDNR